MPRFVWSLIGAALTIATVSTIVLAFASARREVPREVYSLSLAATIIAWVAVFVLGATYCVKAYIDRQINAIKAEMQKLVYSLITNSVAPGNGNPQAEGRRRHLRGVEN